MSGALADALEGQHNFEIPAELARLPEGIGRQVIQGDGDLVGDEGSVEGVGGQFPCIEGSGGLDLHLDIPCEVHTLDYFQHRLLLPSLLAVAVHQSVGFRPFSGDDWLLVVGRTQLDVE